MLIRDIDRLIKEWKDIRGTMLQAIQSDTGNKAKETQKALFWGISSYEASISELSAYTLFNQIYWTTLVSDTLVIYGWKQMSYLEAQKALVNSIVEDNTAELKKECEAARGAKK